MTVYTTVHTEAYNTALQWRDANRTTHKRYVSTKSNKLNYAISYWQIEGQITQMQ